MRDRLAAVNPVFATVQALPRRGYAEGAAPSGDPAALGSEPLQPAVPNYYQTNAINRASATMAECTRTYATPVLQAAE